MEKREINGFVLLDKAINMTSNTALQKVKRLFHPKKAGFLGTLDPLATGMLPICMGRATKQVEVLHQAEKRYRTVIELGTKTSTGDREGEAIKMAAAPPLTPDQVEAAMQTFIGEIDQIPPLYSALKKEGVPLYKLARQGIDVERPARKVLVKDLKLIHLTANTIECEVVSGKGFYVRVLGEDLAEKLGTVGHLGSLRRLGCGGFDGQKMYTLEDLNALALNGIESLYSALLPIGD